MTLIYAFLMVLVLPMLILLFLFGILLWRFIFLILKDIWDYLRE